MAVKVYSTVSCPWCVKVKEYLDSLKIAYENVNIGVDREAAQELVKKTRQMGVPVTQIGEQYIGGYDPDSIVSALKDVGLL